MELGQIQIISTQTSTVHDLGSPTAQHLLQGTLGYASLETLLGMSMPWYPRLSQGACDITNALPTHQVNIKEVTHVRGLEQCLKQDEWPGTVSYLHSLHQALCWGFTEWAIE